MRPRQSERAKCGGLQHAPTLLSSDLAFPSHQWLWNCIVIGSSLQSLILILIPDHKLSYPAGAESLGSRAGLGLGLGF